MLHAYHEILGKRTSSTLNYIPVADPARAGAEGPEDAPAGALHPPHLQPHHPRKRHGTLVHKKQPPPVRAAIGP